MPKPQSLHGKIHTQPGGLRQGMPHSILQQLSVFKIQDMQLMQGEQIFKQHFMGHKRHLRMHPKIPHMQFFKPQQIPTMQFIKHFKIPQKHCTMTLKQMLKHEHMNTGQIMNVTLGQHTLMLRKASSKYAGLVAFWFSASETADIAVNLSERFQL